MENPTSHVHTIPSHVQFMSSHLPFTLYIISPSFDLPLFHTRLVMWDLTRYSNCIVEVRGSWMGYFIPVRYGLGLLPDGTAVGASPPPSASVCPSVPMSHYFQVQYQIKRWDFQYSQVQYQIKMKGFSIFPSQNQIILTGFAYKVSIWKIRLCF